MCQHGLECLIRPSSGGPRLSFVVRVACLEHLILSGVTSILIKDVLCPRATIRPGYLFLERVARELLEGLEVNIIEVSKVDLM
jgi:hypothetical protein